jgi:hypothetical protein
MAALNEAFEVLSNDGRPLSDRCRYAQLICMFTQSSERGSTMARTRWRQIRVNRGRRLVVVVDRHSITFSSMPAVSLEEGFRAGDGRSFTFSGGRVRVQYVVQSDGDDTEKDETKIA